MFQILIQLSHTRIFRTCLKFKCQWCRKLIGPVQFAQPFRNNSPVRFGSTSRAIPQIRLRGSVSSDKSRTGQSARGSLLTWPWCFASLYDVLHCWRRGLSTGNITYRISSADSEVICALTPCRVSALTERSRAGNYREVAARASMHFVFSRRFLTTRAACRASEISVDGMCVRM